jgi:uncharacterized protein YdeI (YjbR/CyaY-like superfamily)
MVYGVLILKTKMYSVWFRKSLLNGELLRHGFKEYCALLFFKGALLHDPQGILIQQTENVQSARKGYRIQHS